MVASRIIANNGYKPMNNNPLPEDARCFYATSGLNEQAAALKDELTAAISQQMSPELEKLTQQGDFIGQLDRQLGNKQDALKQLTKAM